MEKPFAIVYGPKGEDWNIIAIINVSEFEEEPAYSLVQNEIVVTKRPKILVTNFFFKG